MDNTHLLVNLTELRFVFIQSPTNIVDDLCLSLYWQHFVQSQKNWNCSRILGLGNAILKGNEARKTSPKKERCAEHHLRRY